MSQLPSVVAALGASTSAAVAAALQARTAGGGARASRTGAAGLWRFARSQLSRRLWWGSLMVQGVGFTLHALALRNGALTLVQPLLASAVVLAVPLNHALDRTRVTSRELGWAALLAIGLAGFLLSSGTQRTAGVATSPLAVTIAALIALAGVAGCVVGARHAGGHLAAGLLGTAAAIAFAAEAALLQEVAATVARAGPLALLGRSAVYALVLAGAAGIALTQLAYRAGPMSAALPAIILVNPVVSVVFGVVVQHDSFRSDPGSLALETLTLAMLVVGGLQLTRHPVPSLVRGA